MTFRASCLIALSLSWSIQMAGQTGAAPAKSAQVIHESSSRFPKLFQVWFWDGELGRAAVEINQQAW